MTSRVQSLAKDLDQPPALPLRNRFAFLEEENSGVNSDASLDPDSPAATASTRPTVAEEKRGRNTQEQENLQSEISSLGVDTALQHDLLRFTGTLAGKKAVFLVDSGASHDFIAQDFVEKHKLETTSSEKEFSVTLADGSKVTQKLLRTAPLKLVVGEFGETQPFTVFSLGRYDAFLGMPWLSRNNPSVDFSVKEITKRTSSERMSSQASNSVKDPETEETTEVELNFISGKQARHELKRGEQGFLAWISAADEGESAEREDWVEPVSDLEDGQRRELAELLNEFRDVIPKDLPFRLPPLREINHEIDLEAGAVPPSRPFYRLSKPEMDELQQQLSTLLQRGFIEPSKSPYGAPVFFVKKKDGSLRLVCDWRQLNRITINNEACLPNMDDLFDTVQGCKYFSKLDLHAGYNQVRIRKEDIPKTAINTPLGHFQFTVMGFGLCNAPATFQSLMNEVLRPYLRKFVVVFLDDILIFSRTWKEHLEHVRTVLSSLRQHQLFCKPSKSLFGATETLYLGHIITGHSIAPDPKKLEAVKDWPVPKSVRDVRCFLGFTNFFRRFIPRYADLARHLDEITGKHARFSWNEDRQSSFESLKSALLDPPVLNLADTSHPFELHTDASDWAIGAVLLQGEELEQHPVAYASRKLTAAERNYTIAERETLAVIFALRTWKLYLYKHFNIFTDNQAVVYLRSKPHLSSREARWAEFLAEFHFSIRHIPGRKNSADSLTRQSEPRLWAELGSLEFSLDLHPDEAKEIEDGYKEDRELWHIINRLQTAGDDDSFRDKYFWDEENSRLYLIDSSPARLCIPKGPIRLKLLQENHDCISAGHPGRDRTFWNLSKHFYWPGMGSSVKDFVRTCDSCQRHKCARTRSGLLQPLPIPKTPWESISMDLIMGLPRTERECDAVFTFVDRLTKYVHVVPTKSTIDAVGAARLYIDHVFALHGLSKSVVSDRDPRFTSAFFKEVFALLGVKLQMSTANHPQTDGMTERVNRIVEDTLRAFVNHRQSNWDELLPICQFSINNSFSASTGETPFYLTSGQHPITPSALVDNRTSNDLGSSLKSPHGWLKQREEALLLARDCLVAAQARQAFYYDHGRKEVNFQVGDSVLVHREFLMTPEARDRPSNKLRPKWYGPFKIVERISSNAFRLDLPFPLKCHPVFNISALKKYNQNQIDGRSVNPPPAVTDMDGFDRYVVESILSHRRRRHRLEYLVRWVGYKDATWEPEQFLQNEAGEDLIPLKTYKERNPH